MNEAKGPARSNLTKAQKKQAEAAIFGLREIPMPESFTHEEITRMREIVMQHDAKRGGIKEFDINNPPHEPYVHQAYPRMMYHHDQRKHLVVNDAREMNAAMDAGYRKEPFPSEVEPPQLDAASAKEAADIDARLAKLREAVALQKELAELRAKNPTEEDPEVELQRRDDQEDEDTMPADPKPAKKKK